MEDTMLSNQFPKQFFVTGTDTDVGKTVVSAMLILGLNASYWKPIQSGILPCTDTEWVKKITQLPPSHFFPEVYRLSQPLSPHASAMHDNVRIDLDKIVMPNLPGNCSHLIVEGAGGILVPLNDKNLMIDLIKKLNIPVLVVCRSTLGTINHTLLTLQHLRLHEIPILGVIMNGPKNEGNRKAITHYGKVNVLTELEPIQNISGATLLQAFKNIQRPER
jgi:dethiobiotin synthetase